MLEPMRRSRSHVVWLLVLSACLATSAIGCGGVMRVAELAVGPLSPDPDLQAAIEPEARPR